MNAYPDTSFLCALYRMQENSAKAAAHFHKMPESLHVTSLLLYEFRQSIRWQGFLNRHDSGKGFDRKTGAKVLVKLQANIASGAIVVVPAEWTDVHSIAERLSTQHTPTGGYRGFDILHVATALHLGAKEFLTFDINQKKLAHEEGLKVLL
ncbi:MAG TPA: type II toxin-antitoxin system VapC family toxin [Candidatus Methylacidiphilales bacterium]